MWFICCFLVVSAGLAGAEVWMPSIFSEHMVLLKADKVPIWGKADPREKISVTLNGQTVTTATGEDGKWRVDLNLADSPEGPFEMVVKGENTIKIADVVVGEVWLGGGQSNMEQYMGSLLKFHKDLDWTPNAMIRQFNVEERPDASGPADECKGFWSLAVQDSIHPFSQLGYYFCTDIYKELKVPIGFIRSCWGGTSIDPWISREAAAGDSELKAHWDDQYNSADRQAQAMRIWLKESGRGDRPTENLEAFTMGPATLETGWVHLEDKADISRAELPESGAIWLRKDVMVEKKPSNIWILLVAPGSLFDRIYWNGVLIDEKHYQHWPRAKGNRYRFIHPSIINEGMNYLAIRLFSPADTPGFKNTPWPPSLNGEAIGNGWLAKAEFSLSPIAKEARPPVPGMMGHVAMPNALYNGMINPLIPYAIRGALWYQGESNVTHAYQYRSRFRMLINDWRKQWGKLAPEGSAMSQCDFPFYFCQLANWKEKEIQPGESQWAELREAQLMALSVPNTGMAVLIDTGESKDIHPVSKDIAGARLARIALAKTYGKCIPYSGPLYDSMKVEGDKIRISFKYTEGGLVAKEVPAEYDVNRTRGETAPLVRNSSNSELEGFAICGVDPSTPEGSAAAGQKWVWADARIQPDNTVMVWSDKVAAPVAVRYGWADNPTCNLYNKAGLPASPFRTDDFAVSTKGK